MTFRKCTITSMALLLLAATNSGPLAAAGPQEPSMTAPVATVPELFTALGSYVRVAYNNEGYATLGYRVVQNSIGQEWVLLETGITVLKGTKPYTLKREHLTLKTPDGKVIPLATQAEFNKAKQTITPPTGPIEQTSEPT